ncbi:bifunctional folylpolyglutamate synthase/dihydrofolate synthase [Caldibacillus lycopersici]|uniref:Dihydrofolate synthase/folylpolyglutamate synthase n=1 Tax=Perspicuibacillus lycopersici TaxID=1325689 RepID=A0AAE3IVB4_9BACI|nr:folylpolyglutamate synthase/dihydrofolate synthase family protein [Perspicuibacillus lycopersici]MCU9614029.1 bifunctional folylpolyglutamate synthase/dihydrofolate synthase [Perspicuibacillus lycopersici]
MFYTGKEVENWVNNRLKLGIKPGLKRMEWMMERLNHPEHHIKTVHIGGTNGKGSTTTFLRSILQAAGYQVGTFTSPYFEKFNDRICANGVPISDEDLIQIANVILPLAEELGNTELGEPTEFEIITAIGFYYFAKVNPVDIALIEVGLGGRLDSTNIIHPLVSVITTIGYDHMHILGNTLAEIAFEKAGIIKSGVPLITGVKNEEALPVILEQAKTKKAPIYALGKQFTVTDLGPDHHGESFSVSTAFMHYENLQLSMLGQHQIENAALAVMAAQILKEFYAFLIDDENIQNGLAKAYWPGRFEVVSNNPVIIMDGAHNKEGMESFVRSLQRHYPNKRGTILFAAMKDKPLDEMIGLLDKLPYELVFTEIDYPRAAKAEELYQLSRAEMKQARTDWKSVILEKIEQMDKEELLILTGSLYFLSEAKPFLLNFR